MSAKLVGWYNSPHHLSDVMYWDGNSFSTHKKFGGKDLLRHFDGKGLGKGALLLTPVAVAGIAWWVMPSLSHVVVFLLGIALGAGNMYEIATGCRDEHSQMGYPEERAP